jgi:hypothetical protein
MNWSRLWALSLLALPALLLAAPASAPAKAKRPKPISGRLSKSGYTVIALAADGEARVVGTKKGRFKLRPPARRVTLQLRGPDGTYAGPIVVGAMKHGRRAILGVGDGARLGTIKLKPLKGYAKTKRRLVAKWIDPTRVARARKGVPVGAGKVGRVRMKHVKRGAPGDTDLDGVPDKLDIDDDGDLILDGYDRKIIRRAGAASASATEAEPPPFNVDSSLGQAMPQDTVNADGGSSDEQIAASEVRHGQLSLRWSGIKTEGGELDCGTLVYCSAGGTGRWEPGLQRPTSNPNDQYSTATPFPSCCDPDNDGFGSLQSTSYFGPPGSEHNPGMELYPGVTTDQIHAGDVLIGRGVASNGGGQIQVPASLGFVFGTFPVVASYDDGQGNAATFSYPRTDICDFGQACPQSVRAGPNGDIVLALKFWRPQRPRVEGEGGSGKWIDIGNLAYAIQVNLMPETPAFGGAPYPHGFCKHDAYTAVDPSLEPIAIGPLGATTDTSVGSVFGDVSGDRSASPDNTFSLDLDVSRCLASFGASIGQASKFELTLWAYAVEAGASGGSQTPNSAFTYSRIDFRPQP